ncbi:hypothetical protein Afil01_51470 [Actinorhabdospora filicis]|uniref:DUF11 domain-containing protein n=1 Tax=Actinorhabdospora filicis TaxID=1785913 RepID=A0A9W6SQW7_9ACTN|nr:hypothetical protein [Actinorhabdospora filicis]GLZ80340.1 hypothetical protein Afil01_51470 [Actinorhabdospora filicis]
MRVRLDVATTVALTTALALIIVPGVVAEPPPQPYDARPVAFDPPTPGRLAYSSVDNNFTYLAKRNGSSTASFLPADTSPPVDTSNADSHGGLITWIHRPTEWGPAELWVWDRVAAPRKVLTETGTQKIDDPALSQDGRFIAFDRLDAPGGKRDIWSVNVDGTGLRNVTNTATIDESWPTWSPDGLSLAFTRDDPAPGTQIWKIQLSSSVLTRLTSGPYFDGQPAWGQWSGSIAFTAKNRWQRTLASGTVVQTTEIAYINEGDSTVYRMMYPTWQKDSYEAEWAVDVAGQETGLLFTAPGAQTTTANTSVFYYKMDAEIPTVTAVSDNPKENERRPFSGQQIGNAFTTETVGVETSVLHTVRTDVTDDRQFSPRWDAKEDGPSYSPDGHKLAYSRGGKYKADIVITNLDNNTETLVPGPRPAWNETYVDPSWSPDGKYLAYAREFLYAEDLENDEVPVRVSTIAVVELATGNRTELPVTSDPYSYTFYGEPTWSPGNGALAFVADYVLRQWPGEGPILTAAPPTTARAHYPRNDNDLMSSVFPFNTGTPPTVLTDDSACGEGGCRDLGPAWSPTNPNQIAFSRNGVLQYVDPVTHAVTSVGGTAVQGQDPAWSPDGLRLAYQGSGAGANYLYTIPAVGGAQVQVVGAGDYPTQPSWQNIADFQILATADNPTIEFNRTTTVRFVVRNLGTGTAVPTVKLTFPAGLAPQSFSSDGGGVCETVTFTCTRPAMASQGEWNIAVVVKGIQPGAQPVTGVVSSPMVDTNTANNSATTTVTVLSPPDIAVTSTVSPSPGHVGGSPVAIRFTITNGSPVKAYGVSFDVDFPVSQPAPLISDPAPCAPNLPPCNLGDLAAGASITITYYVGTTAAASYDVIGVIHVVEGTDPNPVNDVSTAHVSIVQPIINLNPTLSRPGRVTTVTGKDFPAGSTVTFRWSSGNSAFESVQVKQDGTFTTGILVFNRERAGKPDLLANHGGGPLFGPVKTPFQVVPGVQGPPDFVGRH